MAKQYILEGKIRKETPNRVRKAANIPAVLYGHGLDSMQIEVNYKQFVKTFQQAGYSSLLQLNIEEGKEHSVLIRDIQLHPVKGNVIHADFYQVRMDEVIEANVPLTFINEAPAVKDLGGVLVRNIDEVSLEALPADLPRDIEVDISALSDFEKVIRVADLNLPKGVTLHHEADEVVALVQAPRTEQEIEALSEEVKEDVEAVEGVKKPEAAEEEGAEGDKKDSKKDAKKE